MIKTYRVLAHGNGLIRIVDGVPRVLGFYTSVFVVGIDKTAAHEAALAQVRIRLLEKGTISEQARLEVDSIEEVRPDQVPAVQPGFAFFRE